MKALILLALVAFAAADFDAWKARYNKFYSAEEDVVRRQVYADNLKKAAELGQRNPFAKFGDGPFMDLTAAEFRHRHQFVAPAVIPQGEMVTDADTARRLSADSIDWRTKGAVTHVKDQGHCGSCWSFSTTGNIEGQTMICNNSLVSLSEENLVDCAHNEPNHGCQGGNMLTAMQFLVQSQKGGIDTEASYPYTAGNGQAGTCKFNPQTIGATIKGAKTLAQDEDQMAAYCAKSGPIAVAVDASEGWQTYTGGILTECTMRQLDHGVLVVGYASDNGQDYWIIKNSWGASWGEQGYIRIKKGVRCDGVQELPVVSEMC